MLDLSDNKLGDKVPKGDEKAMQDFREELMLNLPRSLMVLDISGNPCAVNH